MSLKNATIPTETSFKLNFLNQTFMKNENRKKYSTKYFHQHRDQHFHTHDIH